MIFSRGDLQAHGIWVGSCFWFLLFVPQVLEAVGRKDLWAFARVLGRLAGAHSGRENATSGFRLAAVRSRPQLRASPHKLLLAVLPSDLESAGRAAPLPWRREWPSP